MEEVVDADLVEAAVVAEILEGWVEDAEDLEVVLIEDARHTVEGQDMAPVGPGWALGQVLVEGLLRMEVALAVQMFAADMGVPPAHPDDQMAGIGVVVEKEATGGRLQGTELLRSPCRFQAIGGMPSR
mmetsp:Transcript_299/g.2395  ORF Transcript_299/g.2395 Transcript_299/m.2395 type:complete len:128 (-) Transcript_299:791-1174(-)